MDLFRRKQKLIFWIVTIIIVPSFVLVWGVSDFGRGRDNTNYEAGTIGGKSVSYAEFEAFQKRIRAAIGGVPLQFTNAPGAGSPSEELFKYMFAYSLLKDAEKADVTASDLQVGTYIENSHPIITPAILPNDPLSKERAVDNLCRQMQVTRQEFIRGVREWQTIGNYLDADSNLSAVNNETVYVFYSLNKAECDVKRLRFLETEDIRNQAKAELMAKPEAELEREVREYIEGRPDDDARYRDPSLWRFSYLFIPFVSEDGVRQPTEAEIKERYDAGVATQYNNQPLAEVHDRIKAELVRAEVERQTQRNFTVDIDPQLRGKAAEMDPSELVKLTQLAKYGAVAADTGPEGLSPAEVAKNFPEGGEFLFTQYLEIVDTRADPERQQFIDDWKSGFNLVGRPFRSEKGLFRLRLLDYQPSTPAEINGPDGKVRPEMFELALSDLVGRRAAEMARDDALAMADKIRAYMAAKEQGEPAPDGELAEQFESLPTTTLTYLQITESNYDLLRLPIGDLLGPTDFVDSESGERGQELVVMVDRRIPPRSAFEAEPEDIKNRYRQIAHANFQGTYGFTYTVNGPVAIIQPSPTIMGGLADRYNKGQIRVNTALFGGEG